MQYVVTYLKMGWRETFGGGQETFADGSGMTRMRLEDLPAWLASRPGTMILSIVQL